MVKRKRKSAAVAAPARPVPPETAAKALAEVASRLREIPKAQVRRVNTDIPRAVSIALGAAERVVALRPAIAEQLPGFDLAHVDALSTLALAAWYAHLQWEASANSDGSDFEELLAQAVELRRALLGDAEALARRELVDADRVAEIREGRGHLDIANDLVALSALFEEAWPRVEGKTVATVDEVEAAARRGTALLLALSQRGEAGAAIVVVSEGDEPTAGADQMRARAFTALRTAYDQCRRAVAYLRWDDGDADAIAPSLFSRRTRGKRRERASGGTEEGGVDEPDADALVGTDDPAPAEQ